MEARKVALLIATVSLALISLISTLPQEGVVHNKYQKEIENLKEDIEQNGLAEETNKVCTTEVCKQRASVITSYLDESANPCDDFYTHVCKKWIDGHNTTGPSDFFQMLQNNFFETLQRMFESMELQKSSQGVTNKPAILYNICMASTEEDEREDIFKIMNSSGFKEWPVFAEAAENEPMFKNASAVLQRVGMTFLIQYYISKSSLDPNKHSITILPLGVLLPSNESIKQVVEYVKPNVTNNSLEYVINRLKNLESQWITVLQGRTLQSAMVPTISRLEKEFAHIPLKSLLNKEFANVNISLDENEIVEVSRLWYGKINTLLEVAEPVVLYNYLGLQLALHWLSRSPSKVPSNALKTKHCSVLVHAAMKEVVSYLYAKKNFTFTSGAKMEVEGMVRKIKRAFEEALENASWMDEKTKMSAKKKLAKMAAKIGYPTWLLNTTLLEDLYQYVPTLYPNVSFLNIMHIIDKNNDMQTMEKLNKPYDKDEEWFFKQSVVTAYFNPRGNEIVYPAGGLHFPFFELGIPRSLNFGGIGAVLSHEMTHAFAGIGSYYDENGTMVGLQENEKLEKYKETEQCFEYQYGNITDKEAQIPLNGRRTLYENMADSSGLQIALRAYKKLVTEDCENTTTSLGGLPGIRGMKLIFVSYAMLWCNAISDQQLKRKIEISQYSPNRHRVNVAVHNQKEFATTFNCSNESAMVKNFTHTCALW